jgi:uncharacterized membrane protein YedE/YeeE
MSGELRVEDRAPAKRRPIRRRKRQRRVPQTTREAIVAGVIRFAFVLAIVGGLTFGIGWAIAHFTDRDVRHTLSNTFYLAGALCVGGAFFTSAAPISTPYYYGHAGRARAVANSFAYVAIGLALLVIGAILDTRH